MIILDTNILSALMQSKPEQQVIAWLDGIDQELLWITSITVYEIKYGIELLASGKKKEMLVSVFETMLREDYYHKIIEFDVNAALSAGELAASHKKAGNNVDIRDLQIAGIALTNGAYIATRNAKDFTHEGINIINPWEI